MKTSSRAAVLAVVAAAAVASTPLVGSAGTTSTTRAFTWSSPAPVDAQVVSDAADASPMGLVDYTDPTRTDVAWATRASDDRLTVTIGSRTLPCETGTYYYAGVTLLGNTPDWLNASGEVTGRIRVNCTVGTEVHHFHFAEQQVASGKWTAPETPGCVKINRTGSGYRAVADRCTVQDEVVSWKPGKQLSSTLVRDVSLTVDLGVGGQIG